MKADHQNEENSVFGIVLARLAAAHLLLSLPCALENA